MKNRSIHSFLLLLIDSAIAYHCGKFNLKLRNEQPPSRFHALACRDRA
ncbi:hypothetical protein [Halothece sp. PCC 7418]|nr:hypothetical protein [Halothece sp. PCC 7418]